MAEEQMSKSVFKERNCCAYKLDYVRDERGLKKTLFFRVQVRIVKRTEITFIILSSHV